MTCKIHANLQFHYMGTSCIYIFLPEIIKIQPSTFFFLSFLRSKAIYAVVPTEDIPGRTATNQQELELTNRKSNSDGKAQ